ncbi:MAG: proline iminopeptidase-family hydrolase, partial [Bryobacteraceae bacterium]
RPVIFYDQLGCGKSDRPADPSLWCAQRFVRELAQLREALGLERFHLLGHSWGAMLAVDYLLAGGTGVERLILASPALSIPRWMEDADRLRRLLPAGVQAVLDGHEAAGTTRSEAYDRASEEYYKRFLCRVNPTPEPMQRSHDAAGAAVYQAMWGPSEFEVTGNLRDYDRTGSLGKITTPTLFTCGRFDEATPEATAWYHSLVPGSQFVVFEQSAHMAHMEEPARYLAVLRGFLA